MTPKALSREIKFRAWNDSKKDWEGNFSISRIGSFLRLGISQSTEGIHVMQFTGLLDKNGKEIYEGDIVADRSHTDLIFAIEYDNEHAGYYMPEAFEEECRWPISEVELEIIGNIYENPELLN